jgi:hypothetical protein
MLAAAAAAVSGEPSSGSNASLAEEIAALQAEVSRLRAERKGDWLTQQRADDIRDLVSDVLADADTRASLLDESMTAGWDRGFVLAAPDGAFRLRLNAQVQYRFVYNHQDGVGDAQQWGFENRRTKVGVSGHVFDPSWRYKIRGSFSSSTGTFGTSDVYIEKRFGDGWSVRAGQFKPPFLHEWLMSSSRQLAAERSLVNAAFNPGRTDGIQLALESDRFAFKVMLSDGFDRDDTPALEPGNEIAMTGRAEVLIGGEWSQFRDYASWAGDESSVLLGGAVHYEKEESGTAGPEEEALFTWTADASGQFSGVGLSLAAVGSHLDVADADRFGIVAQAGVFIVPDAWDVFVRYEWGDSDVPGDEELSVITAGVNRYIRGHEIKLTADVGYGLNPVAEFWASTGAGWRADEAGRDGQVVIRTQLQLVF